MPSRCALALAVLAGMTWPAQAQTLAELAGTTYDGPVTVQALAPQDGAVVHSAIGEGMVTLSLGAVGRVRLEGESTIEGQRALNFDFDLVQGSDGGWFDESDGIVMTISPEGDVSGYGQSEGSAITTTGKVDAASFQLELSIKGQGVEPDLVFGFDLARQSDEKPALSGRCDHVVWQPRAIANPSGGSMSSVMVPVCIPSTPAE